MAPFSPPFFMTVCILTGTGFAHPNKKVVPDIKSKPGTMSEPTGSICLRGLMLSLPKTFAVLSPS